MIENAFKPPCYGGSEAKTNLKLGKLKNWEELFAMGSLDFKRMDCIEANSVVAYLITLDPSRFEIMIINIRDNGADSPSAIEKAYGQKIADLEANWKQWVATQK